MMWKDFRGNAIHPLRIRGDLLLHARQKARTFSSIYTNVRDLVRKFPRWSSKCNFGVNGRKGVRR
eukprot:9473770-Pyramimonas_sp.AAC.1